MILHFIFLNFNLHLILGFGAIASLYFSFKISGQEIFKNALILFIIIYINVIAIAIKFYFVNIGTYEYENMKNIIFVVDSITQILFIYFLFSLLKNIFYIDSHIFDIFRVVTVLFLSITFFILSSLSSNIEQASFLTSYVYLFSVPINILLILFRKKTFFSSKYHHIFIFYNLFFLFFNTNNFFYWVLFSYGIDTTIINIILSSLLIVLDVSIIFFKYKYIPKLYNNKHTQKQTDPTKAFMEKFCITPREKDVINLIIAGNSNKNIADLLQIKESTVKVIIYNIFKKTKVKNRVELIHKLNE